MNIKDFKASLEYCFKAEVTPFIWGHAGIGKSTVVKQYADENNLKFFPFYLGTQSDIGDILGLASFIKDENGSEVATTFATPIWLKDMIEYCEENPDSGAVIFLDEFNRARRDILNGMFSLALDKTFHMIRLPKNCHIVAAGNPPTDEYYVTDVNETALMARFVHVKLEPTKQEWMEYAERKGFEHTIVSFLKEQPELMEDAKSSFELPVKVDRRSWERIDRLFKVQTPVNLLEQLMSGIIGTERLVAYKMHLGKTDKPIDGAAILAGQGIDSVEKWANPTDTKTSLIAITCDNVEAVISAMKEERPTFTPDEAHNFMRFLTVLPRENFYSLIRKLYKTGNKAFFSFVTEPAREKDLIVMIQEAKGVVDKGAA